MNAVNAESPTPEDSARSCPRCGSALGGLEDMPCPECAGGTPQIPAPPEALGARAAAGFAMMSGQSLLTRVITFVVQIVLAKLLMPADFGLFAVAMGVVAFVAILQQIGVREILVARHKSFARWANVGMWISWVVAGLSTLAIGASAPAVAWYYNDPRLLGLMLVLAISQPLYSLTIVHEARLQIDMKFRELAGVNLVQGVLVPLLMVLCAWLGAGPFSFVLPRLIAGVVRVFMLRAWADVPPMRSPQTRYWKYILLPGVILLLTAMANTIGSAAPALILGKMRSQDEAGFFAFAFNITLQGVILLAGALDNVMFPTLGRLRGDPIRQRQAYLRATRALAAATVPLCVLQALLSRPLVNALFGEKWNSSILTMQILSFGMIYFAVFIPAGSLMMAHSRFKARLIIGVIWGLEFLITAALCAHFFGTEGVAAALALAYLLSGLHMAAAALKPLGGGLADAIGVLLPSHLVGTLAAAAAIGVSMVMPMGTLTDSVLEILAVGTTFSLVYAALLRVLAKTVWTDLIGTITPIFRKLGLRGVPAA